MNSALLVVDASVALRWLLPDPLSQACWKLYERIVDQGKQISAPTLWQYEITSALAKAAQFKSVRQEQARLLLERSAALGVILVSPNPKQDQRALAWSLKLQRASAYNSYYLALAETLGCELWTADRRLFNAVNLAWVHWIEEAMFPES